METNNSLDVLYHKLFASNQSTKDGSEVVTETICSLFIFFDVPNIWFQFWLVEYPDFILSSSVPVAPSNQISKLDNSSA